MSAQSITVLNIEIEKVIPYPKNAKKHPEKQIRQLAVSIREFGFNQPIVVDKKMVVIAGHGRLAAAKEMKLEKVPIIMVDLPEDKAKAYRLADNKLNETDWDMALVIEELREMEADFVDFTGFEIDLGNIDLDEKDTEVDVDSMGSNSTIILKFPHETYLKIIDQIEKVKEINELETNEEVMAHLLENYEV